MGGSDTKQQTDSQSVTQLPPWINDSAQQNYAQAQNIAQRPLQQYQGQLVADLGPQTQQAWNLAATGGAAGQDQYDASQAGYLNAMNSTPQQVNGGGATMQVTNPGNAQQVQSGQISNTNLAPYMNPYTQSVINSTLPIMQQQLGQTLASNAGTAAQQNAFGGSRFGVQQGTAQAQGALGMTQMANQMNSANFAQAQAAAQGDIANQLKAAQANQASQQTDLARNLQAQGLNQQYNAADLDRSLKAGLANQSAGLQQNQIGTQAAQGLGQLGAQAQSDQRANFAELSQAGAQQQAEAQAQIDAQQNKFNQAWQYPYQQLGVLQSALGMTPYGQATMGQSTTQTQQAINPATSILGGLTSAATLLGSGGPFAAGGALAGMFKQAATPTNKGLTKVPGPMALPSHVDTYPAILAPGEAVLNREAAEGLGREKIAALNQKGLQQRSALGPMAAPGVSVRPSELHMKKPRFPQPKGALG